MFTHFAKMCVSCTRNGCYNNIKPRLLIVLAFWPRVARNSPERAHGEPQKASLARVQNALTSCKNAIFRSLSDVNKLRKNVRFV